MRLPHQPLIPPGFEKALPEQFADAEIAASAHADHIAQTPADERAPLSRGSRSKRTWSSDFLFFHVEPWKFHVLRSSAQTAPSSAAMHKGGSNRCQGFQDTRSQKRLFETGEQISARHASACPRARQSRGAVVPLIHTPATRDVHPASTVCMGGQDS
ncbi:hypothetical protein DENSPDRAFT_474769 [Dentipellis sp. KUC8613]|nr:hypothetical protein DENSPDRAFT_474769 [Dentipellis sp. KUC8613]